MGAGASVEEEVKSVEQVVHDLKQQHDNVTLWNMTYRSLAGLDFEFMELTLRIRRSTIFFDDDRMVNAACKRATRLCQTEKYSEALNLFQNLCREPKYLADAFVCACASGLASKAGDPLLALSWAEKCNDNAKNEWWVGHVLIAIALCVAFRWKRAAEALDEALDLMPSSTELRSWYHRVRVLAQNRTDIDESGQEAKTPRGEFINLDESRPSREIRHVSHRLSEVLREDIEGSLGDTPTRESLKLKKKKSMAGLQRQPTMPEDEQVDFSPEDLEMEEYRCIDPFFFAEGQDFVQDSSNPSTVYQNAAGQYDLGLKHWAAMQLSADELYFRKAKPQLVMYKDPITKHKKAAALLEMGIPYPKHIPPAGDIVRQTNIAPVQQEEDEEEFLVEDTSESSSQAPNLGQSQNSNRGQARVQRMGTSGSGIEIGVSSDAASSS